MKSNREFLHSSRCSGADGEANVASWEQIACLPLFAFTQANGGALRIPIKNSAKTTPAKPSKPSRPTGEIITSSATPSLTILVGNIYFKMIQEEGGTFTMGASSEQGSDAFGDEKTTHRRL